MRKCTKCQIEKNDSEFRVEKRTKMGLKSICRTCEAEYAKTPEQRAKRRARSAVIRQTAERQEYMRQYLKRPDVVEKRNKATRAWQNNNPLRVKTNNDRWRMRNAELKAAMNADWKLRNKEKTRLYLANYRAAKLKATPPWVDKNAIKIVYEMAVKKGLVVDHIVPLVNRKVCGLHIHANLQLLTREENCRKGNKWDI